MSFTVAISGPDDDNDNDSDGDDGDGDDGNHDGQHKSLVVMNAKKRLLQ